MSWSISASGDRATAIQALQAQAAQAMAYGYMTEEQYAMLISAVAAYPGTMLSVSASGHNEAQEPNTPPSYASVSISSYVATPQVQSEPAAAPAV